MTDVVGKEMMSCPAKRKLDACNSIDDLTCIDSENDHNSKRFKLDIDPTTSVYITPDKAAHLKK